MKLRLVRGEWPAMSGLSGRLIVVLALLSVSLSGCIGYRQALQDCYAFARARDYDGALERLEQSSLAKSQKNRLLYLMEKGVLLHQKGDYRQSNRVLEEADGLVEALFTLSLSAEGLSFVSSDDLIPYAGDDYESIYLNYYKILNYLALGELEEATVECRRVDEKLNYFADQGDDGENAFLRLLTGLVYEAGGDVNNAFIAYRKARDIYGGQVPPLLWERLVQAARLSGFADEYESYLAQARAEGIEPRKPPSNVAVVVSKGWIPVKREVATQVPTEHGFPVRLAVPELVERPSVLGAVEVSVDGEGRTEAQPVDDLAALARRTLEDKKGRLIVKAVARAVAKELVARKAEKEQGALAGLAVRIAAQVTENADLRSWSTLPEIILLATVPVEPGWHTVIIRAGEREEIRAVEVKEGSLGIVSGRVF